MKGPFALRLIVAAVIIGITYGMMNLLQASLKPPPVVFPQWVKTIFDSEKGLPYHLAGWVGREGEFNKKLAKATGATIMQDRIYLDEGGLALSIHIAVFDDPAVGIWHSPLNCYRDNGWQNRVGRKEPLPIDQNPPPEIYFSTWRHDTEGECFVAFWYQLGDTLLYDNTDLGIARFKVGRTCWPPLIKVLIQCNATSERDKDRVLDFAKQVYLWLNQPSHNVAVSLEEQKESVPTPPKKSEKPKESAKK